MRIVALLFRRVGDSLLATPALRAIRDAHPQATLLVVTEPQTARVFEGNPAVSQIVTVARGPSLFRLAAALRHGGRPDIALDFLSDPRSAAACVLSGARRRVGFDYPWRGWAYSHQVTMQDPKLPVYSAVHKLGLARALGITAADYHTEFHLSHDDREFAHAAWNERGWDVNTPVTAFFVHSRRSYKRWPVSAFCHVIQRMESERLSVPLVLVTPGDETVASEVRARACLPAEHVLRIADLGNLGAVLERCRLLIGNDGGPKHVAVALNIPTVTIFSTDSWIYWTPPDSPFHLAVTADGEDGSQGPVTDVSPDSVYEAARRLLQMAAS